MSDDPMWHQLYIQNKFHEPYGWQFAGWWWTKPSVALMIVGLWCDSGTMLFVQPYHAPNA